MKKILIFAGTTEGRELSEALSKKCVSHTLCVTSRYGEEVLQKSAYLTVHSEKMDAGRMHDFIKENGFNLIIDATHPYAVEAGKNIKEASGKAGVEYIRFNRETLVYETYSKLYRFSTHEECAKELQMSDDRILLTIGSKELSKYCADESLKERLIVRIIPNAESLSVCNDLGIKGKNIIAMQGPFTAEMNEAMIDMYQIKAVVSKISGTAGGFGEKLAAAKKKDIPFYVIGNPEEAVGQTYSLEEILKYCMQEQDFKEEKNKNEKNESEKNEEKDTAQTGKTITLAGVGMGSTGNVTKEVADAVKEADILFGAQRLLNSFPEIKAKKESMYLSEDILPYIKEHPEYNRIVILFSGDSGFYSGTKKLYDALFRENCNDTLKILPGISSVSYLAAKIGVSYEDALILSIHGKEIHNLANKIRSSKKTMLLLSGKKDVWRIGRELQLSGLNDLKIIVGSSLSYENESILSLSVEECVSYENDGLLTVYIENENAEKKVLTPGMANDDFIREKVPMTKEEVREISLCKLHLTEGSILYDIGSGTGSITTEAARLSDSVYVYAIERKKEAAELTEKNRTKYHLDNTEVILKDAPEAFEGLKAATHAFIGGSNGNLKRIIKALYEINPEMRVVINAVSIETLGEIKEVLKLPYVKNTEVVLAQFSHGRNVSDYTLMSADNPVWICSFEFQPE